MKCCHLFFFSWQKCLNFLFEDKSFVCTRFWFMQLYWILNEEEILIHLLIIFDGSFDLQSLHCCIWFENTIVKGYRRSFSKVKTRNWATSRLSSGCRPSDLYIIEAKLTLWIHRPPHSLAPSAYSQVSPQKVLRTKASLFRQTSFQVLARAQSCGSEPQRFMRRKWSKVEGRWKSSGAAIPLLTWQCSSSRAVDPLPVIRDPEQLGERCIWVSWGPGVI